MTIYGATSDDKVVKLATFCFPCHHYKSRLRFLLVSLMELSSCQDILLLLLDWMETDLSTRTSHIIYFLECIANHILFWNASQIIYCSGMHRKSYIVLEFIANHVFFWDASQIIDCSAIKENMNTVGQKHNTK